MLPVEHSNHLFASQNSTPFYIMDNKVKNHEFLSLLNLNNKDVKISEKSPWTIINFRENMNDKRTAIWKIHVSATIFNYKEVFKIVSYYCIENNINFKFLANYTAFKSMNGKAVNRVSAGKFIVIYPKKGKVLDVLEDLYKKTRKFEGPFILTDKRYKDSQILHYRYGEYLPIAVRTERGVIGHFIKDNNNKLARDKRVPYYHIPKWIEDLPLENNTKQKSAFLSNYSVLEALHFSASGGVYRVKDTEGNIYIAKEARAFCGIDDAEIYGTERLKRERDFLKELKETGVTPRVHEWFEEFGNYYLVEEEIKGTTLREFIYRLNPLLSLEESTQIKENYYTNAFNIFEQLLEKLEIIHKHGIVLYDISDTNIIIENLEKSNLSKNNINVRFIDLEHSLYSNEDKESNVQTPGYRSSIKNYYKRDYDKIMSLGLAMIFPLNTLYELNQTKKNLLIQWARKHINEIPEKYLKLLDNYYMKEPQTLPYLINNRLYTYSKEDIRKLSNSIIDSYNDNWIEDRYYYPADPHIFNTNPYSISHGAFGVLYGLYSISSSLDLNYVDYVKEKSKALFHDWKYNYKYNIPSSLLIGNAGILLFLTKINYIDEAKVVYQEIKNQPIPKENNLFYGKAGIIVALLYFWEKTNDQEVKNEAIKIADLLMKENPTDMDVPSLYEGNAGIAIALLIVYYHTKDQKYLSKANEFKNWVLDQIYTNSRDHLTVNRLTPTSERYVESSFLYNGLAGVGMMLILFNKVSNDESYKIHLEGIINSLDYKIQHFPGLMRGLSGIVDFLITCYQDKIGNQKNIEWMINQQISTLKMFEIDISTQDNKRYQGFPGEQLMKISNDLYTGTAGIAGVISRWLGTKNGRKIPSIDPALGAIFHLLEGKKI